MLALSITHKGTVCEGAGVEQPALSSSQCAGTWLRAPALSLPGSHQECSASCTALAPPAPVGKSDTLGDVAQM